MLEEKRRMEKLYDEEYAKRYYDADKALFDFDESVDNLSQVSERYQGAAQLQQQQQQSNPAIAAAAIQGEELHSTEEQGKADEQQQAPANIVDQPKRVSKYQNSASVAVIDSQNNEVKNRRSKSKKELKLNRHKSDIQMTPIGMGKSPKDIAQKKQLQRSKVSEDLKQEIINDLANKRYRKDGSRKVLKRNTSSQFSNYFERRMSNIAMAKLNNATPPE